MTSLNPLLTSHLLLPIEPRHLFASSPSLSRFVCSCLVCVSLVIDPSCACYPGQFARPGKLIIDGFAPDLCSWTPSSRSDRIIAMSRRIYHKQPISESQENNDENEQQEPDRDRYPCYDSAILLMTFRPRSTFSCFATRFPATSLLVTPHLEYHPVSCASLSPLVL